MTGAQTPRRAGPSVIVALTVGLAIVGVVGCAESPVVTPTTPVASPAQDVVTAPPTIRGPSPSATPTAAAPASGDPSPSSPAASPPPAAFKTVPIHLESLAMKDRFYAGGPLEPLRSPGPVDAAGVPVYIVDGHRSYHPVALDQLALRLLDGYRRTADKRYLARARVVADRLLRISRLVRGARYLPYHFDFALHGRADDVLRAPWYSGMAEGMALSVFTRLHAIEGRPDDLAIAATFKAALRPHGRTGPWVSYVNAAGYLWIEEYPGKRPDHTLNGFLFALFGLYDYALETGDPEATQLFIGGLTTVLHYLPQFRNPGGISKYCLLHDVTNTKYHGIHIAQLKALARMTGSPLLARYARLFAKDA